MSQIKSLTHLQNVKRQSYLIINKHSNHLIDPLMTVIESLGKEEIKTESIDIVIIQNVEPYTLEAIKSLIHAGFKGTVVTQNDTLINQLKNYDTINIHLPNQPLNHQSTKALDFIMTPFMPYKDSFISFYPGEKVLFSGYFASNTLGTFKQLNEVFEAINQFHQQTIPSVEFLKETIKKIGKMNIEKLYPMIGKAFSDKNIKQLYRSIVSYDFYQTQQAVLKKGINKTYNYESIIDHMIMKLTSYYNDESILGMFKDSRIVLKDDLSIDAAKTTLKSYKLWHNFFEHVYQEKGIEALNVLEPIVNKYTKLYNIKKPNIYNRQSILDKKTIAALNEETTKQRVQIEQLNTKIDETLDKLLRCPITDLYNEDVLTQHLIEHLNSPLKANHTHGLIALQVDDLEAINKRFGPDKGDETLKNVVYLLQQIVHEGTLLFKSNGPGIFIYKHEVDEPLLNQLVLNLRNKLKASDIFVQNITVSVSIVTIDEISNHFTPIQMAYEMIELARKRLEYAKSLGKDFIVDKSYKNQVVEEGRILLIDEDETNQNLMVKVFNRMNYGVDLAKDINDAFAKLEQHHYDIIISEINLSKLDGFRFKQAINNTQLYGDIPFIIMSHHKNKEVIERANQINVDLVLQKPIIVEELVGHVIRFKTKRVHRS